MGQLASYVGEGFLAQLEVVHDLFQQNAGFEQAVDITVEMPPVGPEVASPGELGFDGSAIHRGGISHPDAPGIKTGGEEGFLGFPGFRHRCDEGESFASGEVGRPELVVGEDRVMRLFADHLKIL